LFNRCTRDFTEFLKALKKPVCPICGVLAARLRALMNGAPSTHHDSHLLCCQHLALAIEQSQDPRIKSKLARSSILFASAESTVAKPRCSICASLEYTTATLRRTVLRLDAKPRFRRAIELGPLFCHKHRRQFSSGDLAPNFTKVQRAKLRRLTEDLAQVAHRPRADSDRIFAQTLSYLRSDHSLVVKCDPDNRNRLRTDAVSEW
jgi:hypothetical protein